MSTKVKLQQLMSVSLIASMGMEHVFCNVMHRFKSSFLNTGSVLFRQGDPILESSQICIIANGTAKVLVDPKFAQQWHQWEQNHADAKHHPSPPQAATTESGGCRCVSCQRTPCHGIGNTPAVLPMQCGVPVCTVSLCRLLLWQIVASLSPPRDFVAFHNSL